MQTITYANWKSPKEINTTFNSATFLYDSNNVNLHQVVFKVVNSKIAPQEIYNIICKYKFDDDEFALYILWVGTKNDYEELGFIEESYTR